MAPALAAALVVSLAAALPPTAAIHSSSFGTLRKSQQSHLKFCAEAPQEQQDFAEFVRRHGRVYKDGEEEYTRRAALFAERITAVNQHNCAPNRPLWLATINHLADWTDAELESLKGLKLGSRANHRASVSSLTGSRTQSSREIPVSFSYHNLSSIRQHRDQGRCGSCWAFAATTAMRARAELRGLPHQFSTGQVVACAPNPNKCGGQGGCQGATTELAYEYALQSSLVQEADFGYPQGGGQPECPADMAMSGEEAQESAMRVTTEGYEEHTAGKFAVSLRGGRSMGMLGWTKLPENREEPIVRALVDSGPLTVSVAASRWWHIYDSGIMGAQDCDENNVIGHAVVLFGYGQENVPDEGVVRYWSLKNSWGNEWGEQGNLRLQRLDNEEKTCDWDRKPEVGSGCEGGPDKVWVCGSCGILYNAAMPEFEPI